MNRLKRRLLIVLSGIGLFIVVSVIVIILQDRISYRNGDKVAAQIEPKTLYDSCNAMLAKKNSYKSNVGATETGIIQISLLHEPVELEIPENIRVLKPVRITITESNISIIINREVVIKAYKDVVDTPEIGIQSKKRQLYPGLWLIEHAGT